MNVLLLGLVLFFAVHSVSIVNDPWRNRMAANMGEWRWKGVYALVAITGFVLIVWGYGLARQDPVVLYTPPAWLHPVAMVLLVPVFPLLLAAYLPGRIQTRRETSDAGRHQAVGRRSPARQRHAGRRVVIWHLPRLGGARPHLDEAPHAATCPQRSAFPSERPHRCGRRSRALCRLHPLAARLLIGVPLIERI